MSQFTSTINEYKASYNQYTSLVDRITKLEAKINEMNGEYAVMMEAQKLLATVSDDNTRVVLDYMTGVINQALDKLFPYDKRAIQFKPSLYKNRYPHINIALYTADGRERDLESQSGTGIRQIISFLYVMSLIEIRKGRRIVLLDEILSGVHPQAKRIVIGIIRLFASKGYQFITVEYGINDMGKIYLVEKAGKEAKATALGDEYNDEVFVFNRPVEEVDNSIIVED